VLVPWAAASGELPPEAARGFLVPLVEAASLPLELLRRFLHSHARDPRQGWKQLLLFLSPITITGGLKS